MIRFKKRLFCRQFNDKDGEVGHYFGPIGGRMPASMYPLETRLIIGSISLIGSVIILYLVCQEDLAQDWVLAYMFLGLAVVLLTNGCAFLVTVLVEIIRSSPILAETPISRLLPQTTPTHHRVSAMLPPILPRVSR